MIFSPIFFETQLKHEAENGTKHKMGHRIEGISEHNETKRK